MLGGAGEHLNVTVSSPLKVHDVAKGPTSRAPDLGEHNHELLQQLGFTSDEIGSLHADGVVPANLKRESSAAD
jgi:crotonobetainyl-CoA:carnitine CoA-transferase CaiB-like acyl-CoA transferase